MRPAVANHATILRGGCMKRILKMVEMFLQSPFRQLKAWLLLDGNGTTMQHTR